MLIILKIKLPNNILQLLGRSCMLMPLETATVVTFNFAYHIN